MAEANQEDSYAFMVELCRISPSQEQLLLRSPFVGENLSTNPHEHDKASPIPGEIPVASTGIVMVSLPETQDSGKASSGPQDVFHTPPEESSLHSSDDQRRKVVVDHCTVNQALHVDDGTQGFVDFCRNSEGTKCVDLGRDSDLGFLDVQWTQEIDTDLVPECSRGRGIEGDIINKVSECQFNEFGVPDRGLSLKDCDDLHEVPLKKLKLLDPNSGFGSSRDRFRIQLQKIKEGVGNRRGKLVSKTDSPCDSGADLQPEKENVLAGEQMSVDNSMDENMGSREYVKAPVVQSETENAGDVNFCEADKFPCMVEGEEKSSDEVIETSGRQKMSDEQPGLRMLPSSITGRLENAAKGLERGEGRVEEKSSVFDVLKVFSENANSDEGSLEAVSLLETAKIRGITFPRPRWWPDKDIYRRQRIV